MFPTLKECLVLFFIVTVVSTTEDEKLQCQGGNGVLKYEVGSSYVYIFGSHSSGSQGFDRLSGFQSFIPALTINGSIILTALSECEFLLNLHDIVIASKPTDFGGKETESSKIAVENSSIKFFMKNGLVEKIFFHPNDSSWTVNLKKTILHMIQNQAFAPSFDKSEDIETSIFGNCVTDYSQSDQSYSKITHLLKCGEGEGSDFISQGVAYQMPLIPNKPIFGFLRPDGYVHCTQIVTEGMISSSVCLTQNDMRGQGLSIVSELKFKEKKNYAVDITAHSSMIPSTVLYNFTKSYSQSMEDNAVGKIHQLLSSLEVDGANKAQVFIDLKKSIARVSNLEQFMDSKYLKEEINRKTFFDAMAEVTSDEAVRLCAKLASEDKLDETTLLNFYMNIAFATSPGIKALEALTQLVKSIKIEKVDSAESNSEEIEKAKPKSTFGQHLLLGASGLAHQFCKLTNAECINVPEYQDLVNAISEHVKSENDQDILIGALHALGNLDALTPASVEAIKKILSQDNNSEIWLEILAMDAFRRDPCQGALKGTVRQTLKDSAKNDQVRIFAYLAASKCIDSEDITVIQAIFNEDNSAVGGFVGSHIRNIRDSSSPSKMHISNTLRELSLPENILPVHNNSRSSKYIEYSTFNEKNNLGFSGEATIIFNPGNIIPEFVSFNATVDVFGRSFNFLEVGLSQRLTMRTMMYYGDEVPANWDGLLESTTAKDSYYRIMGTTIGLGLQNLHEAIQTSIVKSTVGDSPSTIFNMIQPISYIDDDVHYPSISGLPLNIDLQAIRFDTVKIEMIGASSFEDLFNNNKGPIDYKINFNTDSADYFQGSVGLGAHTPVHTGYKVEGKMDHKDNFGFQIISKGEQKMDMDLKINFPNQVITGKDISLDFYSFQEIEGNFTKLRNVGKGMLVGESLASQPRDCFNFFGLSGLQWCSSYRNGADFPKMFSMSLEKENPEMEGIDIKIISDAAELGTSYEMTMSTPGSTTHRLYKLSVKSNQENEMTGGTWDSKGITLNAELDKQKYSAQISMNRTDGKPEIRSIFHSNYDIRVAYSDSDTRPETEMIKFTTEQPKENSINAEVKFDGVLQSLGDFKSNFSMENVGDQKTESISQNISNHIDWKSELFGSTAFDISHFNTWPEWGVSGDSRYIYRIDAKLNHNNRIYELRKTRSVSVIYEKEENDDRFQTVERLSKYSLLYIHNSNRKYEATFGEGFKNADKNINFRNLTLDISSSEFSHPVSGVLKITELPRDSLNSSLTIVALGEKQVEISTMLDFVNKNHEIRGVINEHGEFYGNLTLEEMHQHFHMDIECKSMELQITVDSDIDNDNVEFKQKNEVVVNDKRHKNVLKTESHTVINFNKRTMDYLAKSTSENDKLLSKLQFHVEVPSDYYNGKSHSNMRLEKHGAAYTGSVNQTISSNEEQYLHSNLAMDFQQEGQTPFTYNWDLKVDKDTSHADIYDMEIHLNSDKHFTGVFLAPFDILIQKDITFHKRKGQNVYELLSSSNITNSEKNYKMQTEMLITALANDDKWQRGSITADGYTTSENIRDDIKGRIDFEGKLETTQVQNLTLTVVRTNLQTQATSQLLDASVNKSLTIHSITDFEMTEDGKVKLEEKRVINWVQLVKFHEKEFTIFKEINETVGDNQVSDKIFAIDISAKLVENHHQTKLEVKTHNSIVPDCPVSNFNLTLSK